MPGVSFRWARDSGGFGVRISVFSVLLATALLTRPVFGELAYDDFLIDTGDAAGVLLHGNLTSGEVDDLIVFTNGGEDRQRRFTVYAFDGQNWRIAHAADIDDDVIFVDMLKIGNEDRLLMFRRDHVEWLNAATWTREPLVSAPSVYNVPALEVPRVAIARDVNDDELDDIVLADFDGYWIWLQNALPDGDWIGPVKLRAEPTAITGFRSATYRPRAIYEFDYNGDGKTDLAFWEDDRFLVYLAGAAGFQTEPLELSLPVAFSTDDFAVSIGIGNRRESDQERVMLYGVDDYNGDGIGDIVTNTLTVDGFLSQSTRYDFHFGQRTGGGTEFSATPNTVIESDGIQSPFDTGDFDNDGRTDFGMASINIGIGKIIAALVTGSVRFDVDFYVMRDDAYPEKPNVSKPIKFRFNLRSGSILSGRWMEIGDVTGDGFADLLVPGDGEKIDVYPGTGNTNLFADRPVAIAVDFPDTTMPGGVTVADLNEDGRDDVVIRFPATDDDETNRIGVVLSR